MLVVALTSTYGEFKIAADGIALQLAFCDGSMVSHNQQLISYELITTANFPLNGIPSYNITELMNNTDA